MINTGIAKGQTSAELMRYKPVKAMTTANPLVSMLLSYSDWYRYWYES